MGLVTDVVVGYPVTSVQIDEYIKRRNTGEDAVTIAKSILGYDARKVLTHLERDTVAKLIQLGTDRAVEMAKEVVGIEGEEEVDQPDLVNHPPHYTHFKGLEVIDLTEQLNFNLGNSVKYICRAGVKDPEKLVEDLEKARWYLTREIGRVSKHVGGVVPLAPEETKTLLTERE